MPPVRLLNSFETIRILADTRRLEILRLLMASPSTLTELGRTLGRSPAWIRHHLVILEGAGLVELQGTRVVGRATEKYYRAVSTAFRVEQSVLPRSRNPIVLFSGSHDPALDAAVARLGSRLTVLAAHVGSLNGLTDLRQGICQIAGIHLQDESGEYNRPFVQRFFPDRTVQMVTLAIRTQGLIVARGNPASLRRIEDLTRPGIRFVNRNAGSGTRIWLDKELRKSGIASSSVRGYRREVTTHTAAAECIRTGKADAAIGLQAAAQSSGLGFVPLFDERYDLVLSASAARSVARFLDFIQSAEFRSNAAAMAGYNTAHCGELVPL